MMQKKTDVLVIGAGLSGLMAAAQAAEQGKQVLVVAKGSGALGLSSGCIDLWGYRLDQPEQVCDDPLQEIVRLVEVNPEHPYARVQDVLTESLAYFNDICAASGYPYVTSPGGNWLLPTALGTVRPTYLAPVTMAVDSLGEAKSILVVGFRELKDFYPEVLAGNLKKNAELAADCRINTLMVSVGGGDLNPNTLAHRLERPAVLNEIIKQVKPALSAGTLVFFPPVLGERADSTVAADLAADLGCPVYEVTNIPPALPGQRLQQVLLRFLKHQGVEVIMGCTVTAARVTGTACTGVTAVGNGKTMQITAGTVILATGSFLGGGLKAGMGLIKESIFDLPVKTCAGEWSDRDFLALSGQPFNKFGLTVNDNLQPVDGQGRVVLENVLITGANLAGCNYPVEKCGNGVALATGYKAGKLAGGVSSAAIR